MFYREKESKKSDKHNKSNIDINKSKTFREDQIRERQEKEQWRRMSSSNFFQPRKRKPPTVIISDEDDPSDEEISDNTIKKKKAEKGNFVFLNKDLQLAKKLLFIILLLCLTLIFTNRPILLCFDFHLGLGYLVTVLLFKDSNKVKENKRSKRKSFCKESIPDRINEKNEPQGNWRHYHQINLPYTYIIQSWTYKDNNLDIKHLCPWGMRETIFKKLSSDHCKARYDPMISFKNSCGLCNIFNFLTSTC